MQPDPATVQKLRPFDRGTLKGETEWFPPSMFSLGTFSHTRERTAPGKASPAISWARARAGPHILLGAFTPSSPSPLASTSRTVSASLSRAAWMQGSSTIQRQAL